MAIHDAIDKLNQAVDKMDEASDTYLKIGAIGVAEWRDVHGGDS